MGDSVLSSGGASPPLHVSEEAQKKILKLHQISKLWKYQPVPPYPEAAPSERRQQIQCGNLYVFGANVRGKKHIHGGSNCDDWFEIRAEEEHGMIFIAVSDGAGSKKFSRIGAKISCGAAVNCLRETFCRLFQEEPESECVHWLCESEKQPEAESALWDTAKSRLRDMMAGAMKSARNAVYQRFEKGISAASEQGFPESMEPKADYAQISDFRDLSATLLLAAIIPVAAEKGTYTVIACQVGDGAIALFNSKAPCVDEALCIIGSPDSGDYAGETEFLTSSSMRNKQAYQDRTRIRRLRFDTMLMMTDGVADDYFPASPQLFRLYCDLMANGVLPPRKGTGEEESEALPGPLLFPAIAEEETPPVPLYYTWLICDARKLSLKELWENPAPIEKAACLLAQNENKEDIWQPKEAANRLSRWLKCYVEDTSFDDRTLVIVRADSGAQGEEKALESAEKGGEEPTEWADQGGVGYAGGQEI